MVDLKQFTTVGEVKTFAKLNGYDKGGTDKLVSLWTEEQHKVPELFDEDTRDGVDEL